MTGKVHSLLPVNTSAKLFTAGEGRKGGKTWAVLPWLWFHLHLAAGGDTVGAVGSRCLQAAPGHGWASLGPGAWRTVFVLLPAASLVDSKWRGKDCGSWQVSGVLLGLSPLAAQGRLSGKRAEESATSVDVKQEENGGLSTFQQ